MRVHRDEIATGILVLVTLGVLMAVVVVIGMPGVVRPVHTYRIYFDNGAGIRPGAPVMLGGRDVGQVSDLDSPVPMAQRPPGHPDYEVVIEVKVDRKSTVYRNSTVHLKPLGLMGQYVIDFVGGDEAGGMAENDAEFVGTRIPELAEAVGLQFGNLTGEKSDLARALKNTEQLTNTLKRQPWRLLWPGTKDYPEDEKNKDAKEKEREEKDRKKKKDKGNADRSADR